MVFKRVKPHITLTDDERKYLETITRSRTAELRMSEREIYVYSMGIISEKLVSMEVSL